MTISESDRVRTEHIRLDSDNQRSSDEGTAVAEEPQLQRQGRFVDSQALHERLRVEFDKTLGNDSSPRFDPQPSASQAREEASRIQDDIALMNAEKVASQQLQAQDNGSTLLRKSRTRPAEPVDDFDTATNPVHERTQVYKPPEHPTTNFAKFFIYIHGSSWLVRYFMYIVPIFALLLIPVLMGALLPAGKDANVGGVQLMWFGVWLEVVWLTLWAGRIIAKMIPWPLGLVSSLFTSNSKKWRDLGKQLELPATLFFWWLGILISFLPTMKNHHVSGSTATEPWERTLNKLIIAVFVLAVLNFFEKLAIQLIAISFHLRTYQDRIEVNKFQIGSLVKLYVYSKAKIAMEDAEFEEKMPPSGTRTPAIYADQAQAAISKAFQRVGDVAGTVAGDFTGKKVTKSGHPSQVVLSLLNSTNGSQVLARRLYRTFVRDEFDTVFSGDLKPAFDNEEEADAAFTMFDKDMNGDISMEELEAVCVEIGRERKSITASLKDLDSVVGKLDDVLSFLVLAIFVLVLISLISTSAAGVLTSAGSAVLALSWLFSATAQEFLQSLIFVFVKHPFDVGDRVSVYGNTGAALKGDDYFVKEIALLYTEFKKMEGQVVQAPNSYLNTLFILNMRRSGGLAEAVPIIIRFGTTIEQIDGLRQALTEFVLSEKREYQGKILTELRDVSEVYSLTLNVVFFYKSNWQNELLRLQRRNKFICAMMIAMQNLGIEGPRRNQAGWREDVPMYLHGPNLAPPQYHTVDGQGPVPGGPTPLEAPAPLEAQRSPLYQPPPSILRRGVPSSDLPGRPRGESISQMAKHVDFSLGMQNMSQTDFMPGGEDDEQLDPSRFRSIIREVNEENEAARERERTESTSRASARDQLVRGSNESPHMSGGLFRRATSNSMIQARARGDSMSSNNTHRNRFFGRLGHSGRSAELPRDSLAEEGQAGVPPSTLDPRSGTVSSQAVRLNSGTSTNASEHPLSPLVGVRSTDFELRSVRAERSR